MGRSSQDLLPLGGSVGLNFNPPSFSVGSSERRTQGSISKCHAGWKTRLPAGQSLPGSSAGWTQVHYPFGAHGPGASMHGGSCLCGRGWAGAHRWQSRRQGCCRPQGAGTGRAGRAGIGKGFLEAVGGPSTRGGPSVGAAAQVEAHRGDGLSFDLQRECVGAGGRGLAGVGRGSHFEFGYNKHTHSTSEGCLHILIQISDNLHGAGTVEVQGSGQSRQTSWM